MKHLFISSITLLFFAATVSAQTQTATTNPNVPKGVVTKYTFDQSKIFPGTTRDYWVYVPAQYDGSKPACVFVDQDGVQFNSPAVFDQLIAAHEMPVTVGIFVQPGKVKAANPDQALDRFNRSYEFDGLGDNYVRFLVEELLPYVEREQKLKLSHDGNDRCIAGSSSGAIAAFTAAWERPDQFSRVFSAIGTYVALRGGNEYRALIRKTEPKPIRIFLEDGSNDNNHYGGDWWMANQEMERALTFAGYEVNHWWGTGQHNHKEADQIFADAVRWLWKDWPQPVKAGGGSEKLKEILIPGEDWKLVTEVQRSDGPVANAKGEVFFNDPGIGKTFKIGLDGKPTVFIEDSKKAGGQTIGPDGRLYAVVGAALQVVVYDDSGKSTVVADGIKGNDLCVRADGGIYVTESQPNGNDPSRVWFISPKGEKKVVDEGLKFANGVTFSPDQSLLYVDDYRSHWVYSYVVQPDGSLTNKQKYFHLHEPDTADDAGPDGMRVDRDGRLWVSTRMGLQICDQAGRVNCIIPTPNGKSYNLTFGGENFDTVFVTCGEKIYMRKFKVKGISPTEAPFKPAAPKL
jgi:sugar lactone lactonase YvrE/enterochelin esterase-like enzyme